MFLTTSARNCLVEAMGKTESAVGAIAFSSVSMIWLTEHPNDSEIRNVALAAIEKGRTALVNKYAYYRALERVAEAHDKSVLLSLLDGKRNGEWQFVRMADDLDKAQYDVLLPDVAKAQRVWRMKSYAG